MVRDWGKQKRSFSEVGCCVQIEGNRGFEFWEYFFEESRSSRVNGYGGILERVQLFGIKSF